MIKNLKIDIIYHNTPSDFEFEFNLGGYCRSRILNAKSNNLKEMLTKLALAVTRSRVIIIIGELLGDNGCIAPVAKAISKPLVAVDHRQFHITSPEPINIIEGALPLVSNNGDFCGCIIESGPQSIIFLPNDKSLRNTATEELVSEYLTSLSHTSDDENDIIDTNDTVTLEEENIDELEAVAVEEVAEEVTDEELEEEIAPVEEEISEIELDVDSQDTKVDEAEEGNKIEESNTIIITEEAPLSLPNEDDDTDEPIDENIAVFEDFDTQPEIVDDSDDDDAVVIPLIDDNDVSEYVAPDEVVKPKKEKKVKEKKQKVKKEMPKKEKKEKTRLSGLSKSLIVLLALLFIIIAAITYFVVYLPSLNGVSVIESLENILEINL